MGMNVRRGCVGGVVRAGRWLVLGGLLLVGGAGALVVPGVASAAPSTVVSLTFDDGRPSQFANAFPMLQSRGMVGTFYIISGYLGQEGVMSLADLNTLAGAGMEIGGHTVLHPSLPGLDPDEMKREVCENRNWLLQHGFEAYDFAYPYTTHDAVSEAVVAGCGFNSGRAGGELGSGAESVPASNAYAIRTPPAVESTTSVATMKSWVTTAEQNGGGWVPFQIHDVCDPNIPATIPAGAHCDAPTYVTPAHFAEFLDWLQGEVSAGRVAVKTVHDVVGGSLKPQVAPPPPPAAAGTNRFRNPSLEQVDGLGGPAQCWIDYSNGATPASFTATSDAHAGSRAIRIAVSSIESWGFHALVPTRDLGACAPQATAGHVYRFTGWVKGNATLKIWAFWQNANGVWDRVDWGQAGQTDVSVTSAWTQASFSFTAPAGARAVSAGFYVTRVGTWTVDDMTLTDTTNPTPPPSTQTLTVSKAGSGSGSVSSTPAGVSCGSSCSASFATGTSVTLTAAAASGSTFSGWSGACSGTGSCVVTMSAARDVTATFTTTPPSTQTLTVSKAGSGSGSVSSTPAGVSCGSSCSASFATGTSVTLTAAAASGSTFSGWSGACSGTGSCVVTMSAARDVTATFTTTPPSTQTLTVSKAGSGSGSVSSTPAGVSCGSSCSASFATGTSVTLTAAAASGSTFSGWSGACSGTGSCVVTMSAARDVTATFTQTTPPPPVAGQNLLQNPSLEQVDGLGGPAQCWIDYSNGATPASFTATSDAHAGSRAIRIAVSSIESWGFHALVPTRDLGACAPQATAGHVYRFTGWVKGNATLKIWAFWQNANGVWDRVDWGYDGQTDVSVTSAWTQASFSFTAPAGARAVSAGFYVTRVGTWTVDDMTLTDTTNPTPPPSTQTLTVSKAGSGSGSVSSTPAGVSCGSSCSASFATGTSVTLTAAAASGSTFSGWSGACSGTGSCVVTMSAARDVTATFTTTPPSTQTLTVSKAGSGSGSVSSTPAGVSCGSSCSASFATGTSVTLTAAAASGSTFSGWSGACSGTGSCVVTMSAARDVTATFTNSSAAPVNTAPPTISGQAVVRRTLTCSVGTWSGNPTSYRWVWRRGTTVVGTSQSYRVARADRGNVLTCTVTATNAAGAGSATSAGVTVS